MFEILSIIIIIIITTTITIMMKLMFIHGFKQ